MATMSDWIGTGVNLAFNIPTYKSEREQGKSVMDAVVQKLPTCHTMKSSNESEAAEPFSS